MSALQSVTAYGLRNLFRSRWLVGYGLLLFLATELLFRFAGGGPRAAASLMNLVLIIVPLVSVVLGTLHFSSSREFIELLLAQPVGRGVLYSGLYLGLVVPLLAAFLLGLGLPAAWHGALTGSGMVIVLVTGALLTAAFASLAFLCGVRFDDRARGLGVALLVWFSAVVLWDGLILLVITVFRDYPLERPLLLLTMANPVDLGRILMLLTFDVAALMGYTGAVFSRFFGTPVGMAAAAAALLAWTIIPMLLGLRGFRRKDF